MPGIQAVWKIDVNRRISDVELNKILREAETNACAQSTSKSKSEDDRCIGHCGPYVETRNSQIRIYADIDSILRGVR